MKHNVVVIVMFITVIGSLFLVSPKLTLSPTSVVFAGSSSSRKEVWVHVNVTNIHENMTTSGDVEVVVSSREGVNIAWSTNITRYFENVTYWESLGYTSYMDWLNGTSTLPYHWGEIDWKASEGSLTSISWDKIKYWWDMYSDTGGGVSYQTFMDNTYMADCNLTDPTNDPDIISYDDAHILAPWNGNKLLIRNLVLPAKTSIFLIFKIVVTQPGAYVFTLNSTNPLLTLSPSTWRVGGVATILVPYDYPIIQDAIDAASPGDTIIVYNGTYVGDLSIPASKTDVEIKSAENASVTIKGVSNVPIASWPQAIPNIEINASGVKIHGFIIEGPNYASGYYSSGMVIGASDVEIYDNVFKVTPAETLDEISQAIQTYHKDAQPGVNISGLSIHDNFFTNFGVGSAGYEAIYINLDEGTRMVTIQRNSFNGSVVRAITTERSNTAIIDNVVTTNLAPGLPGGYQGINIGGVNEGNISNVLIEGNVVNGSSVGKGFIYGLKLGYSSTSTFSNVTITGNTIQMNEIGVWIKYSAGGVKVNLNNIFGNLNCSVSNTDSASTLDARYNWWGDKKGPGNETGSLGDYVRGKVEFKPWLTQRYPPAVIVSELYVYPLLVQCLSGFNETFQVDIKLDNVKQLYGFDIKLVWNSSMLNLTDASYTELWGAYPETYPWQDVINNSIGEYHLALTGTGDVPSFNGNATLATLTFTIVEEPAYPVNFTSELALVNTLLTSTKNLTEPELIEHVVYNGTYMCNSTKPKLTLGQPTYIVDRTPFDSATGSAKKFNVDILVANVMKLETFDFNLTYDPRMLKFGNQWQIHVPCTNGWIVWDDTTGVVSGHADHISPLVNGTTILVTIKFEVKVGFVWNTVNRSRSCNMSFTYTNLTGPGGSPLEHEVVSGMYIYKPVPGDLDMSGEVDIVDLSAAGKAFGLTSSDPRWNLYWFADVYVDEVINILDIVIIARNFHRTEPE